MRTLESYALDVSLRVKVSADDIESLLTSALESGVYGATYWMHLAASGNEKTAEELVFQLVGGGISIVETCDGEDVAHHTLTMRRLQRGFALWIKKGHAGHDYLRGEKDDGTLDLSIDGPQADVILQYALFGEQRYG